MSNDIEVELLRERLREYRELLQISHQIMFMPHKDIVKRKSILDKFKLKLIEHGIIEEQIDESRDRVLDR